MAPADSTSSPRDHAADANPDLARKKQRLSEDPGASPTESIIIEADEPEDIGANMDNAIEIEDDLSTSFDLYSDDFEIYPGEVRQPLQQVQSILQRIQANYYLQVEDFFLLAQALQRHELKRADDSGEWQQRYLHDEAEFFTTLVNLLITIITTGDLFDPKERYDAGPMRQAIDSFLQGAESLCRRIIPCLPDVIKVALSRRDSAHASTRQHNIGALWYVTLAGHIFGQEVPALEYIASLDRRLDLERLKWTYRCKFSTDQIISSLATIIRALSGAMRDVKDSWVILQSTLTLFNTAVETYSAVGEYPKDDVESAMEIVNACIVPAIREKHPRALPGKFHDTVLSWGDKALNQHVSRLEQSSATATFQLFISSSADALLPEATNVISVEEALHQVCEGNQDLLAKLIADSWVMQTAKSFICSEIMDIRTVGLAALMARLVENFSNRQHSREGLEHPEIQHAVRFMRKNEIVPYIFGPESRAGLLDRGMDLVTFLAATQTYTDAETDIIWRACSTSVEADFVKASFDVFKKIQGFLDCERLIYIARKYSTTAITCFGVHALDFLPGLLQEIDTKSSAKQDPSGRLALAFVSLELLRNANRSDQSPTVDRLRHDALTAIAQFASQKFSAQDRAQIYQLCIPDILNHTADATMAAEALHALLRESLHSHEAQGVLNLLPVDAAVDELCSFVQARKQRHASRTAIYGILARLELFNDLMTISPTMPEASTRERLFGHLFGEEAFSNEARDFAWNSVALSRDSSPTLKSLFEVYMRDHVAKLCSGLATPRLINIMQLYLKVVCLKEPVKDNMVLLLAHPLWKAIVRFAITAPDIVVSPEANYTIGDMLFAHPSSGDAQSTSVAECQSEFVREHIRSLHSLHDQYLANRTNEDLRYYHRALDILSLVFDKSKEYLSANKSRQDSEMLVVDGPHEEEDQIVFTAQIYGMNTEPNSIDVQARQSTKVSELLAKLPDFTSAPENRIIAGGIEITNMLDKTLVEAGIPSSGVILIRPKYSFGLDLDKVLTPPGPVEQAIMSQHRILEAFLDGPDETSMHARTFLQRIRLPEHCRSRVVSSPTTAKDLFPSGARNRTSFSLFVLRTHLIDFARLGVADRTFIVRAARLLTDFLLDKDRVFEPYLLYDVLNALNLVLRERPDSERDDTLDYFDKGSAFSSRLIELLLQTKSMPIGVHYIPPRTPLRSELAATAYRTLILAYQNSNDVWTSFTGDDAAVSLHERLLLDDDLDFSGRVVHTLETSLSDENVSRELLKFYWRVTYPCLSEALNKSYSSESYFFLTNKILGSFGGVDCDETWATTLADGLRSKLWSHRHSDSPPLFTGDRGMLGLLRLFSKSVGLLKKKRKGSLPMEELPSMLYRRLLFPPRNDPQYRPLITEETRGIVYDLIKSSFVLQNDYNDLVGLALGTVLGSVRETGACFPGMCDWIRPACNAAGIRNLGMTCYMNSLLQQLFGNLQFRQFILEQPIVDANRQATLYRVQELFANMQDGVNPYAEAGQLASTLNVQVGVQEDVHTFYTTLLSRLEDSMPNRETRQALTNFFTGKSVTQIKGDCGHVSSKEEPYTELSITVKNKASLHDSLNEFVQGEPLEGSNKYMCMGCESDNGGRLVNALKRTCLDEVPNSLTFCLKRFAFENILDGENKVNDRFEFPAEIDMSRYKRSYLENPDVRCEPDLFELVGVIVHQGSLSYGHYWSYVRIPAQQNLYRSPWMYLEDGKYFPCGGGLQEVQENCFGGLHWSDGTERPESAYVLFYQRKGYIAEADGLNVVPRHLQIDQQILPKVRMERTIHTQIQDQNIWKAGIALLFSDQFSGFLQWLLDQYPAKVELQLDAMNSLDDSDPRKEDLLMVNDDLDARIGELIANVLLRILLPDPKCDEKMSAPISSAVKVVESRPAVATHIVKHFAKDDFGMYTILKHRMGKVRSEMFSFFQMCLSTMQKEESEHYEETVSTVIRLHASILDHDVDNYARAWPQYLGFIAKIATMGPDETKLVLEQRYLEWIFEIMYMTWDASSRKQHSGLCIQYKNSIIDRTALFDFLHDLLSGHMDLSEINMQSRSERRFQTPRGWQLVSNEILSLFSENPKTDKPKSYLLHAGIHFCLRKVLTWRNFAPGKLVGLLVAETTNENMSLKMFEHLRVQYDIEDTELDPLLYMTLHVFLQLQNADGGVQRCKDLLVDLCKNLLLWDGRERRSLWFFREAYQLVPEAVVHCFPLWTSRFLQSDNLQSRQAASDCLNDIIFGTPIMQDDSLEATRIHGTRRFVPECEKMLDAPHEQKQSRGRWECMITALKHASEYLVALEEDISLRLEQEEPIAPKVMMEYNEVKPFVSQLLRYLEGLRDWEPVTALPTRSIGSSMNRSIEVDDSDELDTSDADADDDFSEVDGF